jgi:transposase
VARVEPGQTATVEYVGEGRQQESLDAYWETLTSGQRAGVEAVGMDLWEPYRLSTQAHVPGAAGKIVHDPFHLVRYMNEAVNEVRKAEHRALSERGQPVLAGTKQLWLYGYEHLPASRAADFERLKGMKLQTSRAWAIKELFREFWDCGTVREASGFFGRWYDWAIRSRLGPVKKVARMFKRHLTNILTFFEHRLTNASVEGLNNRIQSLVKKAYGYRNRDRFKTDILFHLGGLDLYPKAQ